MQPNLEEQPNEERTQPPMGGSREKKSSYRRRRYDPEFRLKAVQLYLSGAYSYSVLCQELGVDKNTLYIWVKRHQTGGPEALQNQPSSRKGVKTLPAAITDKIVELKQQNPSFGIARIAQFLRRCFLLPGSPSTVRQRLQEAQLMPLAKPPRPRNLTRPRFFERASPNQMWQTDIFTFRLGGRYAYLIAYLDDYSRYVVGADLFRSPTAEAVIEVYRIAMGEYQPPQEMLTDNGRQYTSWRGTSRFEAELKKDRVSHIKSRPHHPMTLGKVERFWSSIWQEFLVRVQFESFEVARERIKLWIKYYNHQRPHQGIGGLCPADRFFEIQTELRKTLAAGIQDNLLELALRGQPKAPFYMVGRMDGQSVVLRAEKGKLKLSVTDQNQQPTQELTYDLHSNQSTQRAHDNPQPEVAPQTTAPSPTQCPGQSAGGPGGVDRTLQSRGSLPPNGSQLGDLPAMAVPGDGGHAASPGESGEPRQGRSPQPAVAEPVAETTAPGECRTPDHALATSPAIQDCQCAGLSSKVGLDETTTLLGRGPATGPADPAGPKWSVDGHGGSSPTATLPQGILSMGTAGLAGDAGGGGTTAPGASSPTAGSGENPVDPTGAPVGGPSGTPAASGPVAPTTTANQNAQTRG